MRSSHIFSWSLLGLVCIACGGPSPTSSDREHSLADVPAQETKLVVTGPKSGAVPVPSGTDAVDVADPSAPPPSLPSADRVLSADLYGDGDPEVFVASGAEVRWGAWPAGAPSPAFSGRHTARGMLQAWTAADLDGDGRDEVLMAFGMGRGFADAEAEVVLLKAAAGGTIAHPLWSFAGPRTQITALLPWPREDGTKDVYVAAFQDRFLVRGGVLPRDGGAPKWLEGHTVRMGMYRAVGDFDGDGRTETAIGRLYGDEKDSDGDLRVLDDDGTVQRIETLRGVRAVGSGDLDGDGRPELLFGDGWHKNYGKLARYRPSVSRWTASGWTTELLEESSDQYAVEQIGVVGGRVVAGGNLSVTIYEANAEGWVKRGEAAASTATGTWTAVPGGLVVGGAVARRVAAP